MRPVTTQQPDEDNQKSNVALRAVHGVLLFEDAILAWGIDVGIDAQFKRRAAVTRWANEGVHYCHVSHRPNVAL